MKCFNSKLLFGSKKVSLGSSSTSYISPRFQILSDSKASISLHSPFFSQKSSKGQNETRRQFESSSHNLTFFSKSNQSNYYGRLMQNFTHLLSVNSFSINFRSSSNLATKSHQNRDKRSDQSKLFQKREKKGIENELNNPKKIKKKHYIPPTNPVTLPPELANLSSFNGLGLSPILLDRVKAQNFEKPTDIQTKVSFYL